MQPDITVTLFKRKGQDIWQMQYSDPMNPGRKVQRTTGTKIKRDAERVAGQWEKDVRNGHDTTGGRMPWSDFRAKYERNAMGEVKETTADKTRIVLNSLEKAVRFHRLCDLTTAKLTDYKTWLREHGAAESTIKSYLAHVKAALSWAVNEGYLPVAPRTRKPKRAKQVTRNTPMKGRPITGEEFERMLAKIADALTIEGRTRKHTATYTRPTSETVESWRFYLQGLWLSGLRLSESLELHWTDPSRLCVDFTERHPTFRISGDAEKGGKDRTLAMAPEFAEFLMTVPEDQREGFVFNPSARHVAHSGRLLPEHVSRVISGIGKAAGVKVAEATKLREGKPVVVTKFASAHDLRRSFGERWATKIMPQVLQELMRHESIETTLRFYVGQNAQRTAAVLWTAHKATAYTQPGSQSSPGTATLQNS